MVIEGPDFLMDNIRADFCEVAMKHFIDQKNILF